MSKVSKISEVILSFCGVNLVDGKVKIDWQQIFFIIAAFVLSSLAWDIYVNKLYVMDYWGIGGYYVDKFILLTVLLLLADNIIARMKIHKRLNELEAKINE